MDTSRLITEIAAEAKPVPRLPPPWMRTTMWLAFAVPAMVIVVAVHGLDVDVVAALGDHRFVIEQMATVATVLVAAAAAFDSTIPGRNRRWYWLTLIPLGIWLAAVGAGCVSDWRALGPAGLRLRVDTGCLLPMVLIGVVPTVTMFAMLRKGAPLSPRLTLILGAVATAGLVNFALRLFHVGDVSVIVLVWHLGLVAALSAVASIVAPRLLGWGRLVARLPNPQGVA